MFADKHVLTQQRWGRWPSRTVAGQRRLCIELKPSRWRASNRRVLRRRVLPGIAGWLGECWSAAAEEISIAATTPPTGRDLMEGKHSGAALTSTPRRREPG